MLKVHIWFKKKKKFRFQPHLSVFIHDLRGLILSVVASMLQKQNKSTDEWKKGMKNVWFICYALTLLRHKMSNQYGFLYPHSNQTHLSTCIHRCTCFVESLWTCRHKNPKNLKELSKKLLMSLKDLIKSLSCPAVTSVLTSTGESSCCQSCSCPHSPKHTYNPLN